MKNRKGFTLVEVLAIIVILGLIAVITIPIIDETLKKAKRNAAKDSAHGLTEVAKQYYYKLEEATDEPVNYTCDFKNKCSELDIEGARPTSGAIRIDSIGLVSGEVTFNEKYTFCIYKNNVYDGPCEKQASLTLADEVKKSGIHIYNPDGTVDTNQISTCIRFDVVVKTGTTAIPFCVIDETETTVTLISRNKVGTDSKWGGNTQNNQGPNTILTNLLEETKDWDKVSVISSYTYDDTAGGTKSYGYKTLSIDSGIATITKRDNTTETIGDSSNKFRARLITYEEVMKMTNGYPLPWMADIWTLSSANSAANAYRILPATVSYPTMITGYAVHDSAQLKPVIVMPKSSL